jgi:hypothetical protein
MDVDPMTANRLHREDHPMSKSKVTREIPFADIERLLDLAAVADSPPVGQKPRGGYWIRVLMSERIGSSTTNTKFDYFDLAEDGEVLSAPRGYAKDFRPGRVTGLAEAVERYAGGTR